MRNNIIIIFFRRINRVSVGNQSELALIKSERKLQILVIKNFAKI